MILIFLFKRISKYYYILEESNFNYRYVRLCDFINILTERLLHHLHTVEILIRRRSTASDLGLHCLPNISFGGLQTIA